MKLKKLGAKSVGGLAAGSIPLTQALVMKDSNFGEYTNGLRQFFLSERKPRIMV